MGSNYRQFLEKKSQSDVYSGFKPLWLPDFLFDFQKSLVDWSLRKGKAAIFADCGLGKTPMQLVWAENVIRKTNKPILLLTPLAVAQQTLAEADKFGIEAHRSHEGTVHPNINIANYERLHYFNPSDFSGVVCDESSIIKHCGGSTQKHLTRFMAKTPYRLLCTATAAPNDYVELGTSSEALGCLSHSDMLSRFFAQTDGKRKSVEEAKLARLSRGNYYQKLSYRVAQQIGNWKLRPHAETPFWKWVCSWARACRKPSDLGFSDELFLLPALQERHHIIEPKRPKDGMLFTLPAFGLHAEREERKRTLTERSEKVADLVSKSDSAVIWCHLNAEGDMLEQVVPGAVQIAGKDSDDKKEEIFAAFANGEVKKLITKSKIGGLGLNWQHCNHVVTYASHSYESYYQSIRRCWRFGQKRPVTVDIISTTGEAYVRDNMTRKAKAAEEMFVQLIAEMNNALHLRSNGYHQEVQLPSWL